MEAAENLQIFCGFTDNASVRCGQFVEPVTVGSEPTVDVGAWYCGASSAKPMQAPLSWPVHGTPSISGTSGLAAVVVKGAGELGTTNGTHAPVNWSASSPPEQSARCELDAAEGTANAAIAGVAATPSAKPPARSKRRTEKSKFGMRGL